MQPQLEESRVQFLPSGCEFISEPAVAVSLSEFTRMNRRIGFLEGVFESKRDDFSDELLERIDTRYSEICKGKQHG